MKSLSRRFALVILIGAFLSITATALATVEAQETSTTVAEAPAPTVDFEPAVPMTTPSATAPVPDWTYRYMVPTAIVLALLIAVVTTVQYFTRVVRKRYRIVEE
ncbi:MAG TPA: hypothetical protein VI980_03270 [Acidimicrobiia bacterium]|nr:hypothetical protein [Acidimicrobiia bacterium]